MNLLALALVVGVIEGAITWRNHRLGLGLLLALSPTYLLRFTYFGIPGTVFEFLLVAFVVGRIALLAHGKEFSVKKLWSDARPWNWFALLLLLAATVSLFASPNMRAALGMWKAYFFEPIVLFFFMVPMLRERETRRSCVQALALSVIVLSAVSLYQKFTGAWIPNEFWQREATRRTTSVFGYPNAFALFVAPLIPLFLYYAYTIRSLPPRLLFSVAALGGLVGIVFARTSGAIAALIVAALVVGAVFRRTRLWMATIAVLAAVIIIFSPLATRVADEFLLQGFSGELRRGMWSETWNMLATGPFFGAGLAGYQKALVPFHKIPVEIYLYPHNEFLNFWSETGLAGLLVFVALAALIPYTALRAATGRRFFGFAPAAHRFEATALFAAFIVLFVHGLVDVPYFKNDLAVQFWFLFALLDGVSKK